jgi:hypothetical protein
LSRSIHVAVATLIVALSPALAWSRGQSLGDIARSYGLSFLNVSFWNRDGAGLDADIDGKVGYPLSVVGPKIGGCPLGWNADISLANGALPPGVSMSSAGDISGVPTERGHWLVTAKIANITCAGHRYTREGAPDLVAQHEGWDTSGCGAWKYCWTQQLRFHVTGTGEVH